MKTEKFESYIWMFLATEKIKWIGSPHLNSSYVWKANWTI